jgi:hypothetical protein
MWSGVISWDANVSHLLYYKQGKKKKKESGGGFNKERRIKRSELYDFISLRVVYR